MGEDFLMKALAGAIGSSPVAIVLVWRLRVADSRIEAMETRIATLISDHTGFMQGLLGKSQEE